MNKMLIIAGVMVLSGFLFIAGVALWAINVRDTAIGLENQFAASLDSREMLYDNMVKQVQEKFAVAKLDRETIIQMIDATVEGRTGGSFFKSVQESQPNLDSALFKEVMATIGGKRDEFTRSQQVLAQLQKEHSDLRTKTVTSIIVGGRKPLEYTVVSSSRAKGIMESGEDNDNLINDTAKSGS